MAQARRIPRINFTANGNRVAILYHNVFVAKRNARFNVDNPNLSTHNLARGHRVSWAYLRDRALSFFDDPTRHEAAFRRWTNRLILSGEEMIRHIEAQDHPDQPALLEAAKKSQAEFANARRLLLRDPANAGRLYSFLAQVNSFHANIRTLTPQEGLNGPISLHLHINVREITQADLDAAWRGAAPKLSPDSGSSSLPSASWSSSLSSSSLIQDLVLTPASLRLAEMTPLAGYGLGMSPGGSRVLGQERAFDPRRLPADQLALLRRFPVQRVAAFRDRAYDDLDAHSISLAERATRLSLGRSGASSLSTGSRWGALVSGWFFNPFAHLVGPNPGAAHAGGLGGGQAAPRHLGGPSAPPSPNIASASMALSSNPSSSSSSPSGPPPPSHNPLNLADPNPRQPPRGRQVKRPAPIETSPNKW